MNSWAILITEPDGDRHAYLLPPDLDPVPEEVLVAAVADSGCPADALDQGWDVSVASAPVHPRTLAKSVTHDWTGGVPSTRE